MKKVFITATLALSLTSCAELSSLANSLQIHTMPSYEFYEKFSETNNANELIPLLEKNLVKDDSGNKAFKIPSHLVTKKNFPWLELSDIEDKESFNYYKSVELYKDTKENKLTNVTLNFMSVVDLTKSNFYELFGLNPTDVRISQLKQHCTSFRRVGSFYKLELKNNKALYLFEYSGTGSVRSQTEYSLYKTLPSCRQLGFDKVIKKYGNDGFYK